MSVPVTIDPGFSTPEMAALFASGARVQRLLDFEAALARVQARLGLLSAESASAIEQACARPIADADAVLRRGWEVGTPIMPLLDWLKADLATEHAAGLHLGATTQDAVDTATMLQLRDGAALLEQAITRVARMLCGLAQAHRDTSMRGRTLLQKAPPTTFGLSCARWLVQLASAAEELERAARALPVQLGGPVGTLQKLRGRGIEVMVGLAQELGLSVPSLPWHADRTPILKAVQAVSLVARAVLKMAGDLVLLAQTELGEVRMAAGGSSSIPDKRNPFDAIHAIACAEACLRIAAGLTTSGTHELERAAGAWHTEWLLVPLVFHTSSAALAAFEAALRSLEVDVARMRLSVGEAVVDHIADALVARALAVAESRWGITP